MPLAFIVLCIAAIFDGSYGVAAACLGIFLVLMLLHKPPGVP